MNRRDIQDKATRAVAELLKTEVPNAGAGSTNLLAAILDGRTSVDDIADMLHHALRYAVCVTEGDTLRTIHNRQKDYQGNAVDLAFISWGVDAIPVLTLFAEQGVYETMNTASVQPARWHGLKLVSVVTGNGRAAHIAVFQSGTSMDMPTNPNGQMMVEVSCADGGSVLPAIPTCEIEARQIGTVVKAILYR